MRTEKYSPRTGIMVATADLEKENSGKIQGTQAGTEGVQKKVEGGTGVESKYLVQNFILKRKETGEGVLQRR